MAEERGGLGQGRGAAVAVLEDQPDLGPGRVPAFQPADQPVEAVHVGADHDQHERPGPPVPLLRNVRHQRRFPTTVASGYIRRCSSHCTSIAERKGRQSRAVSVALSIRSYTSM